MVSLENNVYQLREFLLAKAIAGSRGDPFKLHFLSFLELIPFGQLNAAELSLYQKCIIAGLIGHNSVSSSELSRLLGQAPKIDSTPMPWVSDVFGVMSIRWLIEEFNEEELTKQFFNWKDSFLPNQLSRKQFNIFELDIVNYINNIDKENFTSACIPLFLHYSEKRLISNQKERALLISRFMREFREQLEESSSEILLGLMIYVFDKSNQDLILLPPHGWSFDDLCAFLERVDKGLKRWTWEEKPLTQNSQSVKWFVNNEYHVQNLLYTLLAPIFNDIGDEVYLPPVGQKTPRIDLYLPSIHTIIEVKYRKDRKKTFQDIIGEIGEDASLYRTDPAYQDAKIAVFLWDQTRSTQEHTKFKEGILKIIGIDGCIVANAPSTMG